MMKIFFEETIISSQLDLDFSLFVGVMINIQHKIDSTFEIIGEFTAMIGQMIQINIVL